MSIYLIPNFLSNEECLEYISMISDKKDNRPFNDNTTAKTDKYIDPNLSKKFYDRIISMEPRLKETTIGAHKIITTAKYEHLANFGIHTDTGLYYDRQNKIKTRYTVLIYLTDSFEGGQTVFYKDGLKYDRTIEPTVGSCLIFDIDLFHEGLQVSNGTKYWIGCELIGPF
jgi:hypothetical protein